VRWCYRKSHHQKWRHWNDRKRHWPEVTCPKAAMTGSDRVRMRNRFPAVFSYCSSSTSTMAWVCACATGSCAIFALVGPFDRKWRYETSPIVTEGHPKGVEGVCACTTASYAISGLVGCSLGHRCLSFSSPGYHPLSRHFIFI
jgi:hypothetical protein